MYVLKQLLVSISVKSGRIFSTISKNSCFLITTSLHFELLGSLSNHDDDGNKNPTNLHI